MSEPVEKLWSQYRRTKSLAIRKLLMAHYESVVRFHAARYIRSRPTALDIEEDELVSDGMFGLALAIERFDPKRGVKFETFASKGVMGAIVDGLRRRDKTPRLARKRGTALDTARRKFFEKHGYRPTDEEAMAEVGARKGLHESYRMSERRTKEANIEQLVNEDGDVMDFKDAEANCPLTDARRDEIKERVMASMVSDRHREIVRMYYYECLNMADIGERIGLCETRVSQLLKQIRAILCATIREESALLV